MQLNRIARHPNFSKMSTTSVIPCSPTDKDGLNLTTPPPNEVSGAYVLEQVRSGLRPVPSSLNGEDFQSLGADSRVLFERIALNLGSSDIELHPQAGESLLDSQRMEELAKSIDLVVLTYLGMNSDRPLMKAFYALLGVLEASGSFSSVKAIRMLVNKFAAEGRFFAIEGLSWKRIGELLTDGVVEVRRMLASPIMRSIECMVACLVYVGLIPRTTKSINLLGLSYSIESIVDRPIGASNFVSYFTDLVEVISSSFRQYSKGAPLTKVLFPPTTVDELYKQMTDLEDQCGSALAGNLPKTHGISNQEFMFNMEKAILQAEAVRLTCPPTERMRISTCYKKLKSLKVEYVQKDIQGTMRRCPYSFMLHGTSGVGKSALIGALTRFLLQANGKPSTDEYLTVMNQADKYASTYRSHVTGVVLDDIANTRPDFTEIAPTDLIIQFVNNVPLYMNMADVAEKGKVTATPEVLAVTGNVADLNASVYSSQASSIVRRFNVSITVKVKEKYQKAGTKMIDPAKVLKDFPTEIFPDVFLFDLYVVETKGQTGARKVEFNQPNVRHEDDQWRWVLASLAPNGGENITIKQLLEYLRDDSMRHYHHQDILLQKGDRINVDFTCKTCNLPEEMCDCRPQDGLYELRDDLEAVATQWMRTGEIVCTKKLRQLGGVVNSDVQKLVAILAKRTHIHLIESGDAKFLDWVPSWLEGTPIMEYYTAKYRAPRVVKRVMIMRGVAAASFSIATIVSCYRKTYPVALGLAFVGAKVMSRIDVDYAVNAYIKRRVKGPTKYPKWFTKKFVASMMLSPLAYKLNCGLLMAPAVVSWFYDKCQIDGGQFIRKISGWEKKTKKEQYGLIREVFGPGIIGSLFLKLGVPLVSRCAERLAGRTEPKAPQGALETEDFKAIEAREKEGNIEYYQSPHTARLLDSMPMDMVQFERRPFITSVEKATICLKRIVEENKVQHVNGFIIRSGVILVPNHFLPDEETEIFCVRKPNEDGKCGNALFSFMYQPGDETPVGDHDLSLVYTPQTGDVKNMVSALPTRLPQQVRKGQLVYRERTGSMTKIGAISIGYARRKRFDCAKEFSCHNYSTDNFEGLCGSPFVAEDVKPFIASFHVGGNEELRHGAGSMVTRQEYLDAEKAMVDKFSCITLLPESGIVRESINGVVVRRMKIPSKTILDDVHGNFRFLGTNSIMNRSTSKVRQTGVEGLKDAMGTSLDYGPPKMEGPEGGNCTTPYKVYAEKAVKNKPGISLSRLQQAYADFTEPIFNRFKSWAKKIKPLTLDQAVNGIPNRRFIERLAMNTSMGIGFSGTKAEHFPVRDEHGNRDISPEVLEEVEYIKKEYLAGRRVYPPFKACLKDESTPVDKEKVRVFQVAPVSFSLVGRQYFLPLVRFMYFNPLLCETAVGVNPYSEEWDQIANHVSSQDKDRMVAVDYKGFDTSISCLHTAAVGSMLLQLAKMAKYSKDDIKIMEGVIADLVWPTISVNGNLLVVLGSVASGNFVTVILNDGTNSMNMRADFYAEARLSAGYLRTKPMPDDVKFRDYVSMVTFGDDLVGSVSDKVLKYNCQTMEQTMPKYGFRITPADKDSKMKKWYSLTEVDFLKRRFHFDEKAGRFIGPLAKESIAKSLLTYRNSTSMTPEELFAQNSEGALRELSLHDKHVFDEVKRVVVKHMQDRDTLHLFRDEGDFEGIRQIVLDDKTAMITGELKPQSGEDDLVSLANSFIEVHIGSTEMYATSDGMRLGLGVFMWEVDHNGVFLVPSADPDKMFDVKIRVDGIEVSPARHVLHLSPELEQEVYEAMEAERSAMDRNLNDVEIRPQSGMAMETTGFNEGSSEQVVEIGSPSAVLPRSFGSDEFSLKEFFARPIRLDFSWGVGIQLNQEFQPLFELLRNARISNRVSNFNLLSCRIRMKFVINGNGFFFGMARASYLPLADNDELSNPTELDGYVRTHLSQMPGIFLDPTTSTGGELVVPFFWRREYLSVPEESGAELGTVYLREFNALNHATGTGATSADRVAISVFISMEDVVVAKPTNQNANRISPQAGEDELDEVERKGMISKAASAVEKIAGASADLGILPAYSRAAQVGARIAGKVAGAAGYCAPTDPRPPEPFIPLASKSLALSSGPVASQKLTCDPKQEVAIDSKILGLDGEDEHSLKYIATRPSFLGTATFQISDAPGELIWNAAVNPGIHRNVANKLYLPACAGAAAPFTYWNGTMKFTFQIVASAFHRGRLAVVHDPSDTAGMYEPNVVMSEVFDISTQREFTVTLSNCQTTTLMTKHVPGAVDSTMVNSTPLVPTVGNGTIALYVVNELTVPSFDATAPTSIGINVYVSCGDDIEFFVPGSAHAAVVLKPQSGEDVADPLEIAHMKIDKVTSDAEIGEAETTRQLNLLYTGECITSINDVIKRFDYHHTFFEGHSNSIIERGLVFFPYCRGNVAGAINLTSTAAPYNYSRVTYLNWFTVAYTALRGSVRWMMFSQTASNEQNPPTTVVTRDFGGYFTRVTTMGTGSTSDIAFKFANGTRLSQGCLGTVVYDGNVNGVVNVEIPYYTNQKFHFAKRAEWTSRQEIRFVTVRGNRLNGSQGYQHHYVSAGDDFSLHWFTGWPPMYFEAEMPMAQV